MLVVSREACLVLPRLDDAISVDLRLRRNTRYGLATHARLLGRRIGKTARVRRREATDARDDARGRQNANAAEVPSSWELVI